MKTRKLFFPGLLLVLVFSPLSLFADPNLIVRPVKNDGLFIGEFIQKSPAVALKGEDGLYRLSAASRFALAFEITIETYISGIGVSAFHPSGFTGDTVDLDTHIFSSNTIFRSEASCAYYQDDGKCVTDDFSLHYAGDKAFVLDPEITRYPILAGVAATHFNGYYFLGYIDVVFVDEPEVLPTNGDYSFSLSKTAANGKSGIIMPPYKADSNVSLHRADSFSLNYITEETECISFFYSTKEGSPFMSWQKCAADGLLTFKSGGGEHSSIYWKLRDSIEYDTRDVGKGEMVVSYPNSSIFPAFAIDEEILGREEVILDESYFLPTSGKFSENGTILEIPGFKILKAGDYKVTVVMSKSDGTLLSRTEDFFVEYTNNVAVEDPAAAKISVYPNPAETNVRLEFDGCDGVCLYNALGQKLYQDKGQDAFDINLQEYPAGLYILHATKGDKTYKKKVIKK